MLLTSDNAQEAPTTEDYVVRDVNSAEAEEPATARPRPAGRGGKTGGGEELLPQRPGAPEAGCPALAPRRSPPGSSRASCRGVHGPGRGAVHPSQPS